LTTIKLFLRKSSIRIERNPRHSIDNRQGAVGAWDEKQKSAFSERSLKLLPIRRFLQGWLVMLITVCRLYDSYADANRVIVILEAGGLPPSETSVISNDSDTWYRGAKSASMVPMRKGGASSHADGKVEGAAIGAAIGATAATAASLVTMLAIPGVGAVVGAGWLAALLGSMAVGGVAGGLLGALTNAGISEEDAQVFVEGVRRGGTLVAARVLQSELPRIGAMMNQCAVKLGERRELYRRAGWQSFDPNAVPYTADQVRSERALRAPP
jgi:hypothetical protein